MRPKLPFKPPHASKVTVEVCESPSCYGWEKSHSLKNLHKTVAVGRAQKTVNAAFRLARIQARKTRSWRYVSVGWGRHSDPGVHHACVLTSGTSPYGAVSPWKLDEHKFGCKPGTVYGREFDGARRRKRRRR